MGHRHVSLDLARDFKLADPSAYAPRSEIVLAIGVDARYRRVPLASGVGSMLIIIMSEIE